MLIYSTKIPLKQELTETGFVELVIEWIQNSPYNHMDGLSWDGQATELRYRKENASIQIEHFKEKNIIAARFETDDEPNGLVWTTDFIMNFSDYMLITRLERVSSEKGTTLIPRVKPPFLLKTLVVDGYADQDGCLPISDRPMFLGTEHAKMLAGIAEGKEKLLLPVVFASKSPAGRDFLPLERLAIDLKAQAHLLVEESQEVTKILEEQCEGEIVHHGDVIIYFPGQDQQNLRFAYEDYYEEEELLSEKIVTEIQKFHNFTDYGPVGSWENLQIEKYRKLADLQKQENDNYIQMFDEENRNLEEEIRQLNQKIESLNLDNQALRKSMPGDGKAALLYHGKEPDLYENEIRDLIMDMLEGLVKNQVSDSRREHILKDILANNENTHKPEKKAKKLKNALKGYTSMNNTVKSELEEIGFEITSEKKHIKMVFCGDPRYNTTIACTSSDWRSGPNEASDIIKNMM